MKFPPQLTDRALKELFERRDKGDPNAVKRITEGNLRLVEHIARKFKCDPEEVFQEGAFGLQKAALKFDPSKGFKFSTYAGRFIEGSIQHHLTKDYKAPLPTDEVDELLDDRDTLPAHEQAEQNEAHDKLFAALKELPYEERRILELRWGLFDDPQSLRKVALTFECSPARIKKIEQGALKKLSDSSSIQTLRSIK
jgi:RNA polymerase sporulation-specific sigma factor